MQAIRFFLSFLIFSSMGLCKEGQASSIICDPMQTIAVNVELNIEEDVYADLKQRGIQEVFLTPAIDNCWTKSIPTENGAMVTFVDQADALTIAMQEGILVTYRTCKGDVVYALCQGPQDLLGQFPKDVKLYLDPVYQNCTFEVVCTQCP